ncbi:MAG: efflux RND transporter periplasmic adaptor subunit [bacterium]
MTKRILVPLLILIVLVGAGSLILQNPPSVQRGGPPTGPQTVVEVIPVASRDYQIKVSSYGTVQPRTRSILVAQVSGQIVDIEADFRAGGFFDAGDTLLTIDPRDYEADVEIAQAALMDALQTQAQEEARVEQARQDWQRLGEPGEEPSDLVLRKPQLQAARARVRSAQSALTKARLDLERSRITAPFSGRVLKQMVDLGQVVTVGTQLAEVFATDYVEIRLPIRNADLEFVDLPENQNTIAPFVEIKSNLGSETTWQGEVIRTEGAIDEVARQLHVVAQVNDPFGTLNPVAKPLKIGEYVTAEIDGKRLEDVIVIPGNTIYQNSYVYVVENNLLQRRDIDISWQNGVDAIIEHGLVADELLVTTPLGQITSGTAVRIAGEQTAQRRPRTPPANSTGAAN